MEDLNALRFMEVPVHKDTHALSLWVYELRAWSCTKAGCPGLLYLAYWRKKACYFACSTISLTLSAHLSYFADLGIHLKAKRKPPFPSIRNSFRQQEPRLENSHHQT